MRHIVQAAAAGAVGALAGLIAGMDGRIALFLPSVALAFVAGAHTARRGRPPSSPTIAVMLFGTAVWLAAFVIQSDLYEWPNGFETSFTGTGYCGDFTCGGQVFVTMPFVVCLVYVIGAVAVTPPRRGRHRWLLLGPLAYAAAFTATWLWLSASTQDSLFERHVYPYSRSGRPVTADLWPFVAAGGEYRALPLAIRRERAAAFYDSVLSQLAADNYFDAAAYRDTFISGSAEADPSHDIGDMSLSTGQRKRYRDLFRYSMTQRNMPRRDLPRLTRDAARIALVPAVALLAVLWARVRMADREVRFVSAKASGGPPPT